MDVRIRFFHRGGEAMERFNMGLVMTFVLRACPSNKIIESLHLDGHVFHLGVDDANRFLMYRFCGCLDRGIVLVYGLQKMSV